MSARYRLHLACNDHRNGQAQDYVEALEIHPGLAEGGGEALISVERYGEPLVCQFHGMALCLGSLMLPVHERCSWAGNWCWETLVIDEGWLQQILGMLVRGQWQWSTGTEEGLRLWHDASVETVKA